MVQSFLAKARAMVTTVGDKRKSGDDTSALAPPPTKAKGSAPPPSKSTQPVVAPSCPATSKVSPPAAPPATRVRGKSPEGGTLPVTKAKALSLKPVPLKNSGPSSSSGISAFERTRQALIDAKSTREAREANEGKAAAAKPIAVKAVAGQVKTTEPEPKSAAGDDKTKPGTDDMEVETHSATPAPPVEPAAPDLLVTPPPKANQFASPNGSPDALVSDTTHEGSSRSGSDEFDDDDPRWLQGHSQRSYYGSRGESWWSRGDEYYPAHYCYYWDYNRNRGVYARGDQSWTYTSPAWKEHGSWDGRYDTPSVEAPAFPDGGDSVLTALHSRLPTTIYSPDEASPDGTPGEVPSEIPAPSGPGDGPGEDAADAEPTAGKTWRTDKHGNPLNPAALYMRFYRQIRSTLDEIQHTHIYILLYTYILL